ncbi:MAG: hypothetical protein GC179_15305 [Anaerolineaceae bacterium]|nr:hypothetical protein [Anaerolineaceae bacterium]
MNSNRLPLIGLVIMIIVAIFALGLQQQAVNDARTQMTRAASADNDKGTAVAMAQAASGTQVQAEIGQSTALAAVQGANTAQATAQAAAGTAVAQLGDAGTRSAQFAATTTANADAVQATVTMHAHELATLQAESTAEVATLQGQLVGQVTIQAQLQGQLGTATAQVDLAEFARKAAEDDRANALSQLWTVGTRQADSSSQLATAQVLLTNAPPATPVPRATATPEVGATSENDTSTNTAGSDGTLGQTFESSDKKVQVGYPNGWFAREGNNGTITIVNDEAMYTRTQNAINPGQIEVDILAGTYSQFNLPAGTTPDSLMKIITDNIASQQPKYIVSTPEAIKIGSYTGVQVLVDDGENDLSISVLRLSDSAVALVYGLSAKGEGASNEEVIMSIAGSLTYIE